MSVFHAYMSRSCEVFCGSSYIYHWTHTILKGAVKSGERFLPLRLCHHLHDHPKGGVFPGQPHPAIAVVEHGQ